MNLAVNKSLQPMNSQSQRFRSRMQAVARCWQLYLLILPAVVAVFVFNYIPMYGIQIAFKDFRSSLGIWNSEWVGFKHFARFITFPDFWKVIRNTLGISLYSISTFPCAVILALMINEINSKVFKKTVQMISYAPHFISVVVICSMVRLFLSRDHGLIYNLIVLVGLDRQDFITLPHYFSTIYVWSGVWQGIGWGTIIYLAALSNVSPELIEAARIDGANRFQVLLHVNFPFILPTVVTLLILSTGSVLSVGFEKIFLLQNPLNMAASRVISTYVYEMGIGGGQFSYSSAIGLFNNIINIAIIAFVNQVSKRVTQVSLW